MAWRYMEEWAHPYPSRSGITYISTGMNINMMNSARIQEIEYKTGLDLKKRVDEMCSIWEARKQKWESAAADSLSLEEYLQNKFYSKKNTEDK
jgi:hypothetical protein